MRSLLQHSFFPARLAFVVTVIVLGSMPDPSAARSPYEPQVSTRPSLVMSEAPPPKVIYRRGSHDTVLNEADLTQVMPSMSSLKSQVIETPVTLKAAALQRDLDRFQGATENFSARLDSLESEAEAQSAAYYTLVGSINADLQMGTTSGNPILVDRWQSAESKLDSLSSSASRLSALAKDLSYHASGLAFLQEQTKAAFAISGAVDADHRTLTRIEDEIARDVVESDRLIIKVNDSLARRTGYLRTERANLQTLSLAINNGELFGKSLSTSVFKRAEAGDGMVYSNTATDQSGSPLGSVWSTISKPFSSISPAYAGQSSSSAPAPSAIAPESGRKPLVVIRFDRPNVRFEQPTYTAVSQALEKYPGAKFDLVAISRGEGNPAQLALSAKEARKNGESVLRSLSDMGLPFDRVGLSMADSHDVNNSEVHIYIR